MSDVRIPYASETLPRHWRVQQAKTLYDIQLGKMLQTKSEGSDDTADIEQGHRSIFGIDLAVRQFCNCSRAYWYKIVFIRTKSLPFPLLTS